MDPFQPVKLEHLALTQYYRWFQVYERPLTDASFQHQLHLLTDDIQIESAAGVTRGKQALKERLAMFEGWQNSHHVKKTAVQVLDTETLALKADVLYQNIRPDASHSSYTIQYDATLKLQEKDLPLFSNVKITRTGESDDALYADSYIENRGRSFMHYWCYCIESAQGDSAAFKELLANQFEFHISDSAHADSFLKFDDWIASLPSRIIASAHYPKHFSAKENGDSTIQVSVDFDWQGMSADNKPMNAETHHEWVLENNMEERFARLKQMKVNQIRPFAVMEPLASGS